MRFMTGVIVGFIVVIVVNGVMLVLAVNGQDPVVDSYSAEAR